MLRIIFKGFDGDEFKRAEKDVRTALGKPNGALEFEDGILAADEEGLVAVIGGTDKELGDSDEKYALVDTVFDQIAAIATSTRRATCKLEKGQTSRTRGPSK